MRPLVCAGINPTAITNPVNPPITKQLFPIYEIFNMLSGLIGKSFSNVGKGQERNRSAKLHRLVCRCLGYKNYQDNGQFPDIPHQLLEIKLQTSTTIDLGLICPDSLETLDIPKIGDCQIRYCDVRYVLFHAKMVNERIILTHLFLTTGEHFFSRFPQFQGKVLNKKLQIPLPRNFFSI